MRVRLLQKNFARRCGLKNSINQLISSNSQMGGVTIEKFKRIPIEIFHGIQELHEPIRKSPAYFRDCQIKIDSILRWLITDGRGMLSVTGRRSNGDFGQPKLHPDMARYRRQLRGQFGPEVPFRLSICTQNYLDPQACISRILFNDSILL
jgi:hypothetical protein